MESFYLCSAAALCLTVNKVQVPLCLSSKHLVAAAHIHSTRVSSCTIRSVPLQHYSFCSLRPHSPCSSNGESFVSAPRAAFGYVLPISVSYSPTFKSDPPFMFAGFGVDLCCVSDGGCALTQSSGLFILSKCLVLEVQTVGRAWCSQQG